MWLTEKGLNVCTEVSKAVCGEWHCHCGFEQGFLPQKPPKGTLSSAGPFISQPTWIFHIPDTHWPKACEAVIAVAGVFTKYWLYHVPMVFVCRQLELHLQVKKNFKFVSVSVVGVRSIFVLTCKRMKWMIRHEHKRKWTRKNKKKKTKYWLLLLRNFPFSFWFLVNQGGNFKYVLLHC